MGANYARVAHMSRLLTTIAIALAATAAISAEPAKPPGKLDPETERLKGYWVLASTEKEEQTKPGDMGLEKWWYWSDRNEFGPTKPHGKPVIENPYRAYGTRYKLYPKNRPSALQADGSPRPTFYKLDGNTLTICYPGPKAPWAREFKTRAGDKRTEIKVFKRLPDIYRLSHRVPYEVETGKRQIGLWFADGNKPANLKLLHDVGDLFGMDESEASNDVIIRGRGPVRRLWLFERQMSDDNAPDLAGIPGLEELGFSHLRLSDDAIRHVAKISSLRSLSIHETPIGDKAIEHIETLTGLAALSLRRTKITGPAIKGVSELRKLTSLRTDVSVTDDEAPTIAEITGLKELRLENTKISDDTLALLWRRLPALEILHLNSDFISDQGIVKLAEHPKLRNVVIAGRKASRAVVEETLNKELGKRGGKAVWVHADDARDYFEHPWSD